MQWYLRVCTIRDVHNLSNVNFLGSSDVHFWKTGRIGPLEVQSDHVLGHEGAGEVVWVGEQVTHLKVGDRVAVEPGVPCELCYECSAGTYNLCDDVKFSGVPPYPGSIRRYHNHSARYLHKIPDNLSYADGALLEPLSVVLHGFERSPIRLGESTVICGAGPIGLIALACAKASGAATIVVTDLDQGRLDLAAKFVPGVITVRIELGKSAQEMAETIKQTIHTAGGARPRVVYECTGVQSSVITAAYLPRPTGEVMVIGVGKPIMNELPFMHMSLAEVSRSRALRTCRHHADCEAGRSEVYQSIPPLVAHGYQHPREQSRRPEAADHTHIQAGERGGSSYSVSRPIVRFGQDTHCR